MDPLLRFMKQKESSALCGARAGALPLHPAAFEKAGETFRRASRSEVNKIARGGVPAPLPSAAYADCFALTIYVPPVTPPKRYLPSALVLVAAMSLSTRAAPSPVTA